MPELLIGWETVALDWGRALLTAIAGLLVAGLVSRLVASAVQARSGPPHALLGRRLVFWSVLALFLASALRQLGFDLSVVLGAAGVLTVAIGFASQTSASNVISGLFLLAERPLSIGDVVRVGAITGEVLAIDLLSVKLRTFDNLYVRVPNETVMKSEIVNLTRFPIRRFDLLLRFPTSQPLEGVRERLLEAAAEVPVALDEPSANVIFLGLTDAGYELQLSVWAEQASFLELRNALPVAVDRALRAAGISLGAPERRTLEVR